MKFEKNYPIWENVQRWPYFYHVMHEIYATDVSFPVFEKIKSIILYLFIVLKSTSTPLFLSELRSNAFNDFICRLSWEIIALKFVGYKYFTLFLFVFVLSCYVYLIFVFKKRELVVHGLLHDILYFILEIVVPIFLNFSATVSTDIIARYINGTENVLDIVLSIISYLMYSFLFYMSCKFGGKSMIHCPVDLCPWDKMFNFWCMLALNTSTFVWILCEAGYKNYFIINWVIGFLYNACVFFAMSRLPMITPEANMQFISITGLSLTTLILFLFIKYLNASSLLCFVISLIFNYLWKIMLSPLIFNSFCKRIQKKYKFDPDNLFDNDNFILLPDIKPGDFKVLLHYLVLTRYKDVSALLITIIDSERDPDLTVECARILFMLGLMPSVVREKLLTMDHFSVSSSSKQLLCDLQYEVSKINYSKTDNEYCSALLEEKKTKAKISLYAMVNAFLDGDDKQKRIKALNFAIESNKYMSLCEYCISGLPQSMDIIVSYADYLKKYAGDFIRSLRLTKHVESIKSGKYSLFKTENTIPIQDCIDYHHEDEDPDRAQEISSQRTVKSIKSFSYYVLIVISVMLCILLYFPYLTNKSQQDRDGFTPDDYFNYTHLPSHFMAIYSLTNSKYFYVHNNWTLGSKFNELFTKYPITGMNTLRTFLEEIKCPSDHQPILSSENAEITLFSYEFNNITSMRYLMLEVDSTPAPIINLHNKLEYMKQSFMNVTERLDECAVQFSDELSYVGIIVTSCISVALIIVYILVIAFGSNANIRDVIDVLSSIESQTLEEYRSNLFVGIHAKSADDKANEAIDNEGALELDEIEADDVETIPQNDFTEEIEAALNSRESIGKGDPESNLFYILYVIIIFVVHVGMYMIMITKYNDYYTSAIKQQLWFSKMVETGVALSISVDALLAQAHGGENVPYTVHMFSNDVPNTEVAKNISNLITNILDKWNNYINNGYSNKAEDVHTITETILEELSEAYLLLYDNRENLIEKDHAATFDTIYWIVHFILLLSYIALTARFISFNYLVFESLKSLALVLKSKYSSVLAILMNRFALGSKKISKFDILPVSELIIAQIKDPIIFFDLDNDIIDFNQQATAQFSFLGSHYLGASLTNIYPEEENEQLYAFLKIMKTPHGIRAKRNFDLTAVTPDGEKIPFTSTLFPLSVDRSLYFALLTRNQTHNIEMKKELSIINRKVMSLLKRLVPKEIASKIMVENAQTNVKANSVAVFQCEVIKINENNLKTNKLSVADITDVCISIMDKKISNFNGIVRIRSFNGSFFFVSGLFCNESEKEKVENLCNFAKSCAVAVNNFLEYGSLLSGAITIGGPAFAGVMGTSDTLFDVWGEPVERAIYLHNFIKPGQIILDENAMKAFDHPEACKEFHNSVANETLYSLKGVISRSDVNNQRNVFE